MNEKIISLEIEIDDEIQDELGTDVISIVDKPAIMVDFFAFREEFSYDDYPKEARENACRAIIWTDENGWGSCGEATGKRRASQLCMGEKISRDTIARMASFKRHQQHKDVPYDEGCGGLMWDAWGGDAGIEWAQRKLEQIDREEFVEPRAGEGEDEFIQRCMSELNNEFPDEEQRFAVCKSMYDNKEFCDDECELQFSTELEKLRDMIIEFAEDNANGEYITEDDVFVNLRRTEFISVKEVIDGLRAFDLLKKLGIKKEAEPEVYWRYMGALPQRKFCKAMMNLSKAGKIFTQAEIERMSTLNPQFAPKGSSTYSVFRYCGGVNCKHYWEKLKVFKNEKGMKIIMLTDPEGYSENLAVRTQNSSYPSPNGSIPNNARLNFRHQFSMDEEQRIIVGAVMIPNMKILRRDEFGEPFYVYFTKDTIKKMSEKFLRDMKLHNTDINHNGEVVQTNTLIESWVSESMLYDKSRHYGFSLPIGTWFVSYKINDDDTWRRIKDGELKGLSLAGEFYSRLVKKKTKMEQDIIDIIKSIK